MVDWLLLILPGTIWGASFLFIAEGLDAVGPTGVTFLRIAIGFATLSCIPAARRPIVSSDWRGTAAVGVLWMAFPLSMFPFAEQHVSSALTGMLNGATPLFVAAVATLAMRQPLTRPVLVGIAVGFAGTVLMAVPGAPGINDATPANQPFGIFLIILALISYGFAINVARPLQLRNGALPVVWRALGIAVLLTAPLGVPAVAAGHWSLRPIAALTALGAFGTGVAYVLTATAAGRMGATRASATAFLIPVIALILGITVRHERVAPLAVAGAAICLGGAWLIRRAGLTAARASAPPGPPVARSA